MLVLQLKEEATQPATTMSLNDFSAAQEIGQERRRTESFPLALGSKRENQPYSVMNATKSFCIIQCFSPKISPASPRWSRRKDYQRNLKPKTGQRASLVSSFSTKLLLVGLMHLIKMKSLAASRAPQYRRKRWATTTLILFPYAQAPSRHSRTGT